MILNNITASDLDLDSESQEFLWSFWGRTNSVRPISFARQLFPTCPKGFVRATKDLGHYAGNKAMAMKLRLDGDIQTALMYESICERIYASLPTWAKGW